MYNYDREFYSYINAGSTDSARVVVPLMQRLFPGALHSVLDLGCGAGAWLAVWDESGCDTQGVDGPYVAVESLLIDPGKFQAGDLTGEVDLNRRFDLVQCLEVAEHLPEHSAPQLVRNLCRHSDLVLFSAAAPGQGGENHINEQPYSFWRDLFAEQGFLMYDAVRPHLVTENTVKPWYRYNSFLFIRANSHQVSDHNLEQYAIAGSVEPADISPFAYRLRKKIIGMLPAGMSTMIAVVKKIVFKRLGRA